MPKFRTTKLVQSYRSTTIPLFWFVQADEEQRRSTESALNEIVDRLINQKPESKRKKVLGVPWLRNYNPSISDIFDTARGFEMDEGHVLGIDAQSVEDKSLLILHCVDRKEPEIGRADSKEAIDVLLGERLYRYTLAEVFGGRPWTRIPVPVRSPEPTIEDDDDSYILPSHIPSGTKLQKEKITLFSLIKLTDEEISMIRQDMGDTTNETTIWNWPHETPASQAETYNIFQRVKPGLIAPYGQTFVMFIDTTHISGPERAPVVVVACKSTPVGFDVEWRYCRLDRMSYEHIYLHAVKTQQVEELWPLIWHTANQGSVNNVVVNYPLFYGTTPASGTDWHSPVMCYPRHFIAKSAVTIGATGALSPRFMVYILCPVTPEELRRLRKIVVEGNGDPAQFQELNLIPREARSEREGETSQEPSGDSNTPLDLLLEFFDTPEYRAAADPPSTFVFLDNHALNNLLTDASEDPAVPVAHIYHHYWKEDAGGLFAVDYPAYLYASIPTGEGLDSTLSNLEVGNMWFWELASMYSDEIGVAFWPEYKGSTIKDILDIKSN
jgi:hypothetical protein